MDPAWVGGPRTLRLDRIGFVPQGDQSGTFGFLDPARVTRACHLIPAFDLGQTSKLLRLSRFRDFEHSDLGRLLHLPVSSMHANLALRVVLTRHIALSAAT